MAPCHPDLSYRRGIALGHFSATKPSRCHAAPQINALGGGRNLRHGFAFSGKPAEFVCGIHVIASQMILGSRWWRRVAGIAAHRSVVICAKESSMLKHE
jgi:hypothetical protein